MVRFCCCGTSHTTVVTGRCEVAPGRVADGTRQHVDLCCPAHAQVQLLADPHGELARGLGLELEAKAMLGTNRSKRYSAVVQDNEIKTLNVEPDGSGAQPLLSTYDSFTCVVG